MISEETPQDQFVKLFGHGYKLAEDKPGKEEAEDD